MRSALYCCSTLLLHCTLLLQIALYLQRLQYVPLPGALLGDAAALHLQADAVRSMGQGLSTYCRADTRVAASRLAVVGRMHLVGMLDMLSAITASRRQAIQV